MTGDPRKGLRTILTNPAWICFTWFGMTAGISLLATPVRFAVPALSRPVALEVAEAVFTALNRAELIALILLLIVVRVSGRARQYWYACAGLALILIAQTAWLLPELAARTEQIVAGGEPPPSMAHVAYSVLEITKLVLLLVLGFHALRADRPV